MPPCAAHMRSCLPQFVQTSFVRKAVRQVACMALDPAVERQDRVLRCLSANQEVAVLVVDATRLVQEAASRHQTQPTATAALGRALMGGLLMGCFRKDKESLQITFNSEGPLRGIQVIATADGVVKGKVGNPLCDPPLRADGKLDVGYAVGPGTLAIVRTQPMSPVPYTGTVEILSGEVAEDLAVYMAESEQTNSAIALGVQISPDRTITGAGGYLIQVLPFVSDETLTKLEQNLGLMPAVSDLMAMGMPLESVRDMILKDIGMDDSVQSEIAPKYGPCEKEDLSNRMMRAVAALGREEVESILEKEGGQIEVTCHFCAESYKFERDEILRYAEFI